VIDPTTVCLALEIAATWDLEVMVRDVPTAFLGCDLYEEPSVCLPEGICGEIDAIHKRQRPLVRLLKTLYGIKQANREYY
jgi:hypothetical protein